MKVVLLVGFFDLLIGWRDFGTACLQAVLQGSGGSSNRIDRMRGVADGIVCDRACAGGSGMGPDASWPSGFNLRVMGLYCLIRTTCLKS